MILQKARELVNNSYQRFCQMYSDHPFTTNNLSIEIVEENDFILRLIAINKILHPDEVSTVDIKKEFSTCDAALMRRQKLNKLSNQTHYIVLAFGPHKNAAQIMIAFYHELAHAYSMKKEEDIGYQLQEEKIGDEKSGYLFWKEFIADYIAFGLIHQDIKRFTLKDEIVKRQINQAIPSMSNGPFSVSLGMYSKMANIFAFILNLEDIDGALYGGRNCIKLPINKKRASGKRLYDMILEMLQVLYEQCQKPEPCVINSALMDNLGYLAIEINLLIKDYDDEIGWVKE